MVAQLFVVFPKDLKLRFVPNSFALHFSQELSASKTCKSGTSKTLNTLNVNIIYLFAVQ